MEQFLRGLLLHHPNANEKIGSGITRFSVGRNRWGGRMFLIHRPDGSNDHFSYLDCIRYFHSTKNYAKAKAISAFRSEVEGQIVEFKNSAYAENEVVPCYITGKLTPRDEAHIHHAPSFEALLARFCLEHDVDLNTIVITSGTRHGRRS